MKRPANSDMMIYVREAFRLAWPGVRAYRLASMLEQAENDSTQGIGPHGARDCGCAFLLAARHEVPMTTHEHAARLWREHFPGVPMPAPRPTPYGGLYVGDGRHIVRITAPPRLPSPRMQHAYAPRYQVAIIDGPRERLIAEGVL